MQLQTIPRTYLNVSLQAARLPVTVAERFAGHDDDSSWPPSLAFESFEANVRQIVGSLLRDEVLVDQGRLRQAKVAELREAVRLEAVAGQRRNAAERSFDEQQQADDDQRAQAEQRTAQREAALERRQDEAKAKVEHETRAREEREQARAAERRKELARQKRQARAASLKTQREALAREKAATAAKADVVDLDRKIETSKATRSRR